MLFYFFVQIVDCYVPMAFLPNIPITASVAHRFEHTVSFPSVTSNAKKIFGKWVGANRYLFHKRVPNKTSGTATHIRTYYTGIRRAICITKHHVIREVCIATYLQYCKALCSMVICVIFVSLVNFQQSESVFGTNTHIISRCSESHLLIVYVRMKRTRQKLISGYRLLMMQMISHKSIVRELAMSIL